MVLFTTEYQNILLITPIGVFLYNFVCCSFMPVFSTVFTGFFHCPGKNTFCHGKNPTLLICTPTPDGIIVPLVSLVTLTFDLETGVRNSVMCKILFSKQYFILKIQNSILFCIYKILLSVYFILYFQNTFFKYFVIFKILFLKILSAKVKLKANLSVTEIRSF